MKTQIDALHKFQNQLLSNFNAQELTYFKRSGWSGLLENIDRLYATMLHDWDVLQKDTDSIEKAVRSLDWSLSPYVKKGEKVSDQAQKVAQVVEDALWRRTPQKLGTYAHSFLQLLGAIVHAEFRGQNVHRIVWQNDGQLIYPAAFVQLPPQFLRWEVEPGKPDLLLHVPDGETATPVPFKPYQFIVALNNAGPDHPLYNATYYGLVAWFSAAKNGLGWFMQYAEQHHLPKPVFHYDNDEDREQLIKDLQQDRVVNAILLYGDRQVEWANMPTGTTMPQKELLELAEAHCHKAILGQTLTSGTDKGSGSLAQAKVHAGVQADEVMKHAEFVADVINRQLIPAIVHLNFGKVEGMPLPELRFKLPQAAANIERAQFWSQVMAIPGMSVVKSEVYDSLGIAMPGDDDEVLEAPGGAEQGLAALLGGGGDDTPPKGGRKPKKEPVDEDSKDEVALAAKARPTDPLRRALPEWVKPIREKILQARRDGASFEELQRMLREARPDTKALAAAFAENVEAGLRGDAEEVEAANPYGCNQYGEGWKLPHNGKSGGKKKGFKIPGSSILDYSDKSVKVVLPGSGTGGHPDYVFLPKSWIEKDKETGDSKVNIPEGKKVRLRGVLNMDVDEDYLENAFKKQQREKSKNDVEKRLKDEAYDYFDEKKENSDEWFDVDEEVDRVVDEWKEERDSTFWKVRNEFLEKENNLGYDESIRKAEEKGEEAAVKIDEKHLSRLREMASKYREGK